MVTLDDLNGLPRVQPRRRRLIVSAAPKAAGIALIRLECANRGRIQACIGRARLSVQLNLRGDTPGYWQADSLHDWKLETKRLYEDCHFPG
jgi:hypothetical protein